jgi:hypothetical protein
MIKGFCVKEHFTHIGYITKIPVDNATCLGGALTRSNATKVGRLGKVMRHDFS